MKVLKKIITIVIFCMQVALICGMEAPEYGLDQFKDDSPILKKALNMAANPHQGAFYTSKCKGDLERILKSSTYVLSNQKLLKVYEKEFQIPESELKTRLNRIVKISKKALPNSKEKSLPQELSAENQLDIATQQLTPLNQINQNPSPIRKFRITIMLTIPDFNSKKDPIYWQEIVQKLAYNLTAESSEFLPEKYYHITVASYTSEKQLPEHILTKIKKALNNANEILKIVYPDGTQSISLEDGAVILGNKVVAFKVAESIDLQKIQNIILKFLSFESLEKSTATTFQSNDLLHVTLGRIRSEKKGQEFHSLLQNLDAPNGARSSLGQNLVVNTFRATSAITRIKNSIDGDRQDIGDYIF